MTCSLWFFFLLVIGKVSSLCVRPHWGLEGLQSSLSERWCITGWWDGRGQQAAGDTPWTACQSSHGPIDLLDQGTRSHLIPSEMSRTQEPLLTGTVVAGAVSGGRNCPWNMGLWGTDWGKKCHGYGVMVGRQRKEMPREYGVMIVWSRLGRNKGGGNQGRGCCEGRAHTQWLLLWN